MVGSGAVLAVDQRSRRSAWRAAWPVSSRRLKATWVGPKYWRKKSTAPAGLNGMSEVDGDEFGLDTGEEGSEAGADGGVVAPEDGGGDAGRRGDVGAADPEHLAGEAGGVPVGHGEAAAWLEDAGELGGDELGSRGEHGTEHGDDEVEGGVGVGEGFGVAFVELDGEAFGRGAFAGPGGGGWERCRRRLLLRPPGPRVWRDCRCRWRRRGGGHRRGIWRRSMKSAPLAPMVRAMTPKSPAIHVERMESLILSMGGALTMCASVDCVVR